MAAARETQPDVVLIDIQMPRCNGLEAISALQELVACLCRVIILTVFSNKEDYVFQALYLGARRCLPKETPPEELIRLTGLPDSGPPVVRVRQPMLCA